MDKEKSAQEAAVYDKMLYLLQKEILTFEEACLYLGRSASSMYKLTSKKLIPYYQPGRKLIYFKRTELDAWTLQHRRSTTRELEKESLELLLDYHSKRKTSGS